MERNRAAEPEVLLLIVRQTVVKRNSDIKRTRVIAFGYSRACNSSCGHCVARQSFGQNTVMGVDTAEKLISELARANVNGISFTAGEPLLFLEDINRLIRLCRTYGIFTRIVTNAYWATTPQSADTVAGELKKSGLSQLRISFSRW
ncbi:MAG: radical SAM protein, partial [Gammaproteobacteria bacterium]|nr:radical SAM protein [Gammaproteobacteria bacterium]